MSYEKNTDIYRIIITSKMELFVALVSGFQLLTNVTKNSIIGVTGVLDQPMEYYDMF